MESKFINRLVDLAITQARKVDIAGRERNKFRHGAVLFKKKFVLNTGYNRFNKTHPKAIVTNEANGEIHHCIHAEFDALRGCRTEGASLLVVRIAVDNNLKLSKPCNSCWHLIQDFNIRNVYWSNEKGEIDNYSFY